LSVILYHHHYYYFGYPNFLYLVNHIIVILPFRSCGSLSCQFCLSTWLLTFYLGHSVCYLCLLCSFGDNFVCCLSLLDQGHCFVVIIYHHLIPLSGICGCRYPVNRVPPHTGFKTRQGAGGATTRCHMSRSLGPRLPTKGSGVATCPAAPNLASLSRTAPVLPHVPWLRTSPPCQGGLRYCHVSHGSGPCLPVKEGSSAATCPVAPDLASLLRRAPVLSCVPRLRTSPPY
jgi:hypothetical protein